jgi:superfamily II DNA helicase RecQ
MRIENLIRNKGFKVAGIHGDLGQAERFRNLDAFKKGNATVLVATDVAARGLDIPNVMLVINVTFPLTVEDYVHRIGRTGRAGATGTAITFFTETDKGLSGGYVTHLYSEPRIFKENTNMKQIDQRPQGCQAGCARVFDEIRYHSQEEAARHLRCLLQGCRHGCQGNQDHIRRLICLFCFARLPPFPLGYNLKKRRQLLHQIISLNIDSIISCQALKIKKRFLGRNNSHRKTVAKTQNTSP